MTNSMARSGMSDLDLRDVGEGEHDSSLRLAGQQEPGTREAKVQGKPLPEPFHVRGAPPTGARRGPSPSALDSTLNALIGSERARVTQDRRRATSIGRAPSAIRTPISCVRGAMTTHGQGTPAKGLQWRGARSRSSRRATLVPSSSGKSGRANFRAGNVISTGRPSEFPVSRKTGSGGMRLATMSTRIRLVTIGKEHRNPG